MLDTLGNFVLFQLGWFACVWGAASGHPDLGPIVVLAILALHFGLLREKRGEAQTILAVGVLGSLVECGMLAARVYRPAVAPLWGWVCPLFLVALWFLFAFALNGCLRWLQGRLGLAALFGLVGGPLSYGAGERLGAIRFNDDRLYAAAAMGLVWGAMTPLVLWIARALKERAGAEKPLSGR